MADEDWGEETTTTTAVTQQKTSSNDENNNNTTTAAVDGAKKFGFRSFDKNNNNNNNNNNTGFGSENKGFGERRPGGFGFNRGSDGDNNGVRGGFKQQGGGDRNNGYNNRRDGDGGFRSRQQSQDAGERRGGFNNRQSNDENGGERRGFGNNNRSNDENQTVGKSGFGSGFRPRQNNNENQGERRGFGNNNRSNDENGGERRGFNNNRSNDENGGERRVFNNNRSNDENGVERRGFGNNNRSNDESRSFGRTGAGGFARRDNNNENGGERRGFGNNNRSNDENQGERRGFGNNNKSNDENGGERRGFGNNNRSNDENGGERRGFGNNNRSNDESRSFGRTGAGGFARRDNNNEDGAERKGGFNRHSHGDSEKKEGEPEKERYVPPPIEENEETLFHTIKTGINFKKQAEIPAQLSGEDTESIKPIEKFEDAQFSENLDKNIKLTKYEIPTPVQRYAIPIIIQRRDLMACAQTGSGKTAAYLLPILKNILEDGVQSGELSAVQTPQALVLAPTRELAIQIVKESKKFSYGSIIKSNILYGGTVTGAQLRDVNRGTNILVATPGRLLDIVGKGQLSLEKVKYIVLDEADRMLDLGFEGPVREILGKCTEKEKNIFMFSATFPKEIQKLAQDFLKNYLFLTIGVVGGANTDVEQTIYATTHFEKRNKLLEILNEVGNERIMIFLEHKKQADILAFFLCQKNYPATSIHGDRLQSQREKALTDFTLGEARIIVCTQVAARGLDISDVNHVINYDLPQTIDEYVHRIGRTGRCGNIGSAISFYDKESENDRKLARNLVRILEQAGKKVPDWLTAEAEGAGILGHGLESTNCVKDIRSGFKSLALTNASPIPSTAASTEQNATSGAKDDDEW